MINLLMSSLAFFSQSFARIPFNDSMTFAHSSTRYTADTGPTYFYLTLGGGMWCNDCEVAR